MTIGVPALPAPLRRRVLAYFLDGFVLIPVWFFYAVALDAFFGPLVAADPGGAGFVVVAVDVPRVALELSLTLLTDAAYYAGSWVRWGMTPGQRVCSVAVSVDGSVDSQGPGGRGQPDLGPGRLPAQVATTRWAVLQLLPLCVGSLGAAGALPIGIVAGVTGGWVGFLLLSAVADPMRRAFHDRVAGTIVVVPAPRPST